MDDFNSDVMSRLQVATTLLNEQQAEPTLAHHPVHVFREAGYAAPADESDWQHVAEVAARLQELFPAIVEGREAAAIAAINAALTRLRVTPQLEQRREGPQLHFHSPGASFADGWAAGITAALALAYSSGEIDRIGRCVDRDCPRYFLDRGRNRQRRFCSLRCQNRAKSAAYRGRVG